jgi:hypothetical protein
VRGLNKHFNQDPLAFLQRFILVTLPGQPCPTCHCVMDLGVGADPNNPYFRPEPMVLTIDLMAGSFPGGLLAGHDFQPAVTAAGVHPAGLAYDNPVANYAALQVMKVGQARQTHAVGWLTKEHAAYWLPWTNQGVQELHLNDHNVKFFFTAMFSGCTFAVATPLAGGVADPTRVWVTHIAWNPGAAAPAAWGGGAFVGGTIDAQRLEAERDFYIARRGAGTPVRSIVLRPDALVGVPGTPMVGVPAVPLAAGGVVAGDKRYYYGATPPPVMGANPGRAFIAGWRDAQNAWHFAVQKHPAGYNNGGLNVPRAGPLTPGAVRQFV